MEKVVKKKNETRKNYLLRVALIMLEEGFIENVHFDGAECDSSCLADDLRAEFNIKFEGEHEEYEDEDDDDEETDTLVVPKKRKTKKKK